MPTDEAVGLAHRILGGRTIEVGWNRRVRAVISDRGVESRWRGVLAVPAYRWSAHAARLARGVQVAVMPVPVRSSGPSILSEALPRGLERLEPSVVKIGTPRGPQTVVVRLEDERSRPVAVSKVAVNEAADAGLEREAQALVRLKRTGLAPALLGSGIVEERRAIFVEFVSGRPVGTGRTAFVEALRALPKVELHARRWHSAEHPWVLRVCAANGLDPVLATRALPGLWPEVWTHGDFAPWNLIRRRDGRVVVIDWDEGVPDGFVGVDVAQFAMSTGRLMRGAAPAGAASLAEAALRRYLGLDSAGARAVTLLAAAAKAAHEVRNAAAPEVTRYWHEVMDHCGAERARGS